MRTANDDLLTPSAKLAINEFVARRLYATLTIAGTIIVAISAIVGWTATRLGESIAQTTVSDTIKDNFETIKELEKEFKAKRIGFDELAGSANRLVGQIEKRVELTGREMANIEAAAVAQQKEIDGIAVEAKNSIGKAIQETERELGKAKSVLKASSNVSEIAGTIAADETFRGLVRASLTDVPVGAIVPWHKKLAGGRLPDGWVECNGPIKAGDPEFDENALVDLAEVPDLNSTRRFLRGGLTSGVFEADAFQNHSHGIDISVAPAGEHSHEYGGAPYCDHCGGKTNNSGSGNPRRAQRTTTEGRHTHEVDAKVAGATGLNGEECRVDSETRPINMSVVWIIRVR